MSKQTAINIKSSEVEIVNIKSEVLYPKQLNEPKIVIHQEISKKQKSHHKETPLPTTKPESHKSQPLGKGKYPKKTIIHTTKKGQFWNRLLIPNKTMLLKKKVPKVKKLIPLRGAYGKKKRL